MKNNLFNSLILLFSLIATYGQNQNPDRIKVNNGEIEISPVLHGSLVLKYNEITIFIDPYGGSAKYENFNDPSIILITDTHGDHLHLPTLDSLNTANAIIIAPPAVAEKLQEKYSTKLEVLKNGQGIHRKDIFFRAVPMYNLPETADSRHPKGRGNGYVISIGDTHIYISGDTADIPEMRMLKDIDIAFVCMNIPYTMNIEQAADAVLDFKPKIVYPYHYRGAGGFSDIKAFKLLVNDKSNAIEVRLKDWYSDN